MNDRHSMVPELALISPNYPLDSLNSGKPGGRAVLGGY